MSDDAVREPCPQCPRRAENGGTGTEGTCRGLRHHAFCRHMEEAPERWGPIIRDLSPWFPPAQPAPKTWPGMDPRVPVLDEWAYVTRSMLVDDTRALIRRLPPSIDLVVGVARSGLGPAWDVACHLHLPMLTISHQFGIVNPGHGVRLAADLDSIAVPVPIEPRHVLVLDDTAATGREMRVSGEAVRARWPDADVTRAVIYCHPFAAETVDVCARYYGGLHYLDWNWCNAGHGQGSAFDFDGILCEDCPPEDDDDGPRYAQFLTHAVPFYLPRRRPARLIVTARHAMYEGLTREWLGRHRVQVDRLVMRDWEYENGHDPVAIARWKAAVYAAADECLIFAESDPLQARIIHHRTGKVVLCPSAATVFPHAEPHEDDGAITAVVVTPPAPEAPSPPPAVMYPDLAAPAWPLGQVLPTATPAPARDAHRAIMACPHAGAAPPTWGASCGCTRACRLRGSDVRYRECVLCPEIAKEAAVVDAA